MSRKGFQQRGMQEQQCRPVNFKVSIVLRPRTSVRVVLAGCQQPDTCTDTHTSTAKPWPLHLEYSQGFRATPLQRTIRRRQTQRSRSRFRSKFVLQISSFQPTLQTTIRGSHPQTQMAQNILCSAPRPPANTEKVAGRKTHETPQTTSGSPLANADGAKPPRPPANTHRVATRKRRWCKTHHSQTQMAQNLLRLAPRRARNTKRVATRKRRWRKTYCI